jgi:ribosomal protein S18 acetylase RimI-like enzyme
VTILIRKAVPSDHHELTRLAHAAKRHWGYSDELLALWKDSLTITADDLREDLVFCAERDGVIAGFCSTSGDGAVREVEHLWVMPRHIGSGLGRALLEHVIHELRAAGVERLRIESDPNAVGFYEKMGACRIGDVPATPAGRTLPLLELVITREPRPEAGKPLVARSVSKSVLADGDDSIVAVEVDDNDT